MIRLNRLLRAPKTFVFIFMCVGNAGFFNGVATASSSSSKSNSNLNESRSRSTGSPESLKLSPRVISLNIMVAGLAGLGKSTFCKALLDFWWQKIEDGGQQRNSNISGKKTRETTARRRFLPSTMTTTTTKKKISRSTTDTACNIVTPTVSESTTDINPSAPFEYYDEDANTILRVKIIDTPGFGNRVNHRNSIKPITDYIASCRHRRFRREQSPSHSNKYRKNHIRDSITINGNYKHVIHHNNNGDAGSRINSNKDSNDSMLVHICLYFISPGRFLAIDRHFMKHVQDEVTIVPIIAKADTMTDDEIGRFRKELTKIWQEESIDVYSLDDDDGESDHPNHKRDMFFGVRKKKKFEEENNDDNRNDSNRIYYRGREKGEVLAIIARDGTYPWGTSCSLDPEHSDLNLIRDSLLSEHTERFLELAADKYLTFRDQQIARRKKNDFVRYAAIVGLVTIQLRKVEAMRLVYSKIISFLQIERVFSNNIINNRGDNGRTISKSPEAINDLIEFQNVQQEKDEKICNKMKTIFGGLLNKFFAQPS